MKTTKEFELKLREINILNDKLLEDLKRVANLLQKDSVSSSEYDKHGNYSGDTLVKRFGSWNNALGTAGLTISYIYKITDDQLFNNLLQLWEKLGRQPQRRDMIRPLSSFSGGPYFKRFGSWNKSLVNFIEWIDRSEASTDHEATQDSSTSNIDIDEKHVSDKNENSTYIHKTTREISQRLRFSILLRDGFTCRRCGRSPLKEPGKVELEVDHKTAWDNGGETIKENLETLCFNCNRGKSNIDVDYV